jgi:acetate kinase
LRNDNLLIFLIFLGKSLKFSILELAGEQRFVSSLAEHLQNLDALIHGDRRADEQRDLGQFNVETEYGQAAVKAIMEAVMGRNNSNCITSC